MTRRSYGSSAEAPPPPRHRPVGGTAPGGLSRATAAVAHRVAASVTRGGHGSSAGAPAPTCSRPPVDSAPGGSGRAATLVRLVVALACLVLVLGGAGGVGAQELEQVVAGLETTYGRITDLRAEFTQVAHNKSLGQDIRAEGVVHLKKGGKMRWDYRTPSPQQIVSDGTTLWVYTPQLNQVNTGSAPKALAGPAGSFLAGLGRVRDEFTVRFLNPAARVDEAGRPVLDLTPKTPTPVLTRLVLAVDPKDHVVRRAVLHDQLQNTVTMTFTKVAINPGLADSLFTFTPPPGAAVVPLEPTR